MSKMTGMEKPLPVEFEEFPLDSDQQLGANTSNQLPDYLEEWTAPTSTTGKVREGRALESVIPYGWLVYYYYYYYHFFVCCCSRCCTWIFLLFLSVYTKWLFVPSLESSAGHRLSVCF